MFPPGCPVVILSCVFLCLVAPCFRLWCRPLCYLCAAVLCRAGVLVSCGVAFCGLVARCPVLVLCFFFCPVLSLCAVLFDAVLCCMAVRCVRYRSCVPLSVALLVCLPVLCGVVRFVAVSLLLAALPPVLAGRPLMWRCCALWRCLWCLGLLLPVLYLVARLVRCSGLLCCRACLVLTCGVFRCRLAAGRCLVLLRVFPCCSVLVWAVSVRVSCPLWSSGGSCCRRCPCLATWPAARLCVLVRCGALLPCAVSCGTPCPCGAVLWCPVVFSVFSGGVCLFLLPFLFPLQHPEKWFSVFEKK